MNKDFLKSIEKLALKVSKELIYFADGYEEELSALLSFEFKKKCMKFYLKHVFKVNYVV